MNIIPGDPSEKSLYELGKYVSENAISSSLKELKSLFK